jgi:hypothetical protein
LAMTDLLRPADSVSIIVATLNEEENITPSSSNYRERF